MKTKTTMLIVFAAVILCHSLSAQTGKTAGVIGDELDKIEKQLYDYGYELIAKNSLSLEEKRDLARIYFYLGYDSKADSLARELKASKQLNAFTKKIIGLNLYRRGKITKSRKWFEESRDEDQNDIQNTYYLKQIADRLMNSEREVDLANEKMKLTKEIFDKSKEELKFAKQALKEAKETLKKEQARLRKEIDRMSDELDKEFQDADEDGKKEKK